MDNNYMKKICYSYFLVKIIIIFFYIIFFTHSKTILLK